MKKLTILYKENKTEIRGWEKFSLAELLEVAGIFTCFVSKRFRFWQSEQYVKEN